MKKLILRFLIITIFVLLSLITYLSTIGVETNKFNNQISNLIKNINKDLNIDLKQIKLVLDPFNFKINVKTVGPKLKIKENEIDIQNIKTSILINSFFKKNISLNNLEISTNSLEIKNLISFLRKFNDSPELYIFEKIIKKGYLISNINLEFDDKGKIKDNYKINGFIKNGKLSLLKAYQIEKLDLVFNISNNDYQINDLNFTFNNIPLLSEKVLIKKTKNEFLIEGSFENKDITVEKKIINTFLSSFISNYNFDNLNFNSKNNFKFKLNKKFKVSNLKLTSKLQLNNLDLKHDFKLDKFFSDKKKDISIKDHLINIDLANEKLSIKGSGNILFQEKADKIDYSIIKKNNKYNFETSILLKNLIEFDFLGYKKEKNLEATIKLNGLFIPEKKLIINLASFKENDNKLNFKKIIFDKDFSIIDLEKIDLNYIDKNKKKNQLNLIKKNDQYTLSGTEFNANYLLENFIKSDKTNKLDFVKKDFNLNIDIKKVHLNKDYQLSMFNGDLNFKNNKIIDTKLVGKFSDKEKFKFTISHKDDGKVTTLFSDKAEPLVRRYQFIKGFKNGSLDFYSIKKKNKSISTLKIYDFNLKELPILTKILTLASLQGIADILSGEGITFDEFEMNFKGEKNGITIDEIYAIGPAISILMDGYYIDDELISLRGTLVPATTINKFVSSIPVLGKILVGNKTGEGVFGVSFKIKGSPKNPKTTVNPIKTLTPRFITRTLEKIKKN
tara:strand:+ start:5117 stop:7306 length:2190 start_codon:yes stop_codon:yes gene_type:complete